MYFSHKKIVFDLREKLAHGKMYNRLALTLFNFLDKVALKYLWINLNLLKRFRLE